MKYFGPSPPCGVCFVRHQVSVFLLVLRITNEKDGWMYMGRGKGGVGVLPAN